MRSIIIYFSRNRNNYVNGQIIDLKVGNTEVAANMIQKLTDSDMFKIEPLVRYSDDYSECIEEAKQDQKRDARPELKTYPENLEEYDVIYLGYPNYWGTMPMTVFTLLEKFDWTKKIIKPFCTHEGSGMGSSENDIRRICKGASIEKGLAIHGAEVANSEQLIKKWLKNS